MNLSLDPGVSFITDSNVYLSRWPCRRLPFDDTASLVQQLQLHGVTQAWAGSFDALLHKDVGGVNQRTFDDCRQHGQGILKPVGCINPTLPDWQEDVRRCHQDFGMRVIRLHPNYHDYRLADPSFSELLDLATAARLIVQISVRIEDPRTQHPRLRVPDVDVEPLAELAIQYGDLPIVLTNALQVVRGPEMARLAACPNIFIETATQEGVGGLEKLIREFPFERVLFGSHFPFFLLQSSILKLQESELGDEITSAISRGNADQLIEDTRQA